MDLGAVGTSTAPFTRTWEPTDALLYALSVGAGQSDPTGELGYTTENTGGVPQLVVPTFLVPVVQTGLTRRLPIGDFPRGALVHADQSLTVHRPPGPAGQVSVTGRVASMVDKGSGALVHLETEARDADTGDLVVSTRMGYFVRGEGGFGGAHGDASTSPWVEPDGPPDTTTQVPTRPEQALLYRLNGDRNPLHSDPAAAAAAGFSRPILHGLATYGITTRVLIAVLLAGDPSRLGTVSARFTKPVLPGQTLLVQTWSTGDDVQFRVSGGTGATVLDRGRLTGDLAVDR